MNRTNLTRHAAKRMQQRGINETVVRLLETFGQARYQKGGADVVLMTARDLGDLRRAVDRLDRICLIKGEGGRVITVMHIDQSIKTTQHVA